MTQEHDEGDEGLCDFDIIVHVAVSLHETECMPKGELADGVESEELALLAKVHGAVVGAGGDVLSLDELDELGDLGVDCRFQRMVFFPRILERAVILSPVIDPANMWTYAGGHLGA